MAEPTQVINFARSRLYMKRMCNPNKQNQIPPDKAIALFELKYNLTPSQ